ncbi:hypothetical protein AUR64_17610 [Haloprofundus marisrubri]|uniref:Pyrroline-5-carboxylate reductase catalytic N-terminal domain-containing protein n=1 Tax=Haloprofundus marisrubri TaxID=1514971 RepID=A0A0W1R5Z2_9EURY|nr:NAD(P)-binding domain-containing protein [Haloprofundus marisrubri]KTG08498.1 hypothetical protein AUR64_17610 [Haloprofundus marisrubri]
MTEKRIGILGSGDVGKALARGFARHGWDVQVGTRSPEKLDAWLDETDESVSVGSFGDAATRGELVVLAVRGGAVDDVLDLVDDDAFRGKLLLDATNPLEFSDGEPQLLFGGTESLGERVQTRLPDTHVVKCFNTVSNAQMVDPTFEAETPPMFVCGNDAAAKKETDALLVELGWPGTTDAGDITSARYLEALVPLWVRVGQQLGTYDHAFTVVR